MKLLGKSRDNLNTLRDLVLNLAFPAGGSLVNEITAQAERYSALRLDSTCMY